MVVPRRRLGTSVALALLLFASGATAPAAPLPEHPPERHRVSTKALFARLDSVPPTRAFRLESGAPRASGRIETASLDDYVREAELTARPRQALSRMWQILAQSPWARASGWRASVSPSVGLRWGTDSLGLDLMLSVAEMTALLHAPGQGTYLSRIPAEFRTDLAWCVWAIDPTHPEALPLIQSDMWHRGMDPKYAPPPEIAFLKGVPRPAGPESEAAHIFNVAPEVVSAAQPTYPEMAREAKIEGTVRLRVLVGRDGRVKDMRVERGINFLDDAAKHAVSKWVFKPALRKGSPVSAWTDVGVKFELP